MSSATENPEILNKMTTIVAKRRLKNKEMWATSAKIHDEAVQQEEKSLLARVVNFFFGNK